MSDRHEFDVCGVSVVVDLDNDTLEIGGYAFNPSALLATTTMYPTTAFQFAPMPIRDKPHQIRVISHELQIAPAKRAES